MSLPNLFPEGIVAITLDPQQRSLVKVVALLRELVIGSTSGTATVSRANSSALESSRVVKASSGTLFTITSYNTSAGSRWLQFFDAAALPANGAVPLMTVEVPAGTTGSFDFGSKGLPFTSGLVAALSSTDDALTVAVAADGLFLATYV